MSEMKVAIKGIALIFLVPNPGPETGCSGRVSLGLKIGRSEKLLPTNVALITLGRDDLLSDAFIVY
jgi:hypothetical protein